MSDDGFSVTSETVDGAAVLTARGVLDSRTYRPLRDRIIAAALDGPRGVVVDVTALAVPTDSAWAVFTSAHWHVDRWPEIPVVLACDQAAGRSAILRNGIDRYLPLHPTVAAAIEGLDRPGRPRVRRRIRLPARLTSMTRAREFVGHWLTAWDQQYLIPVAKVVATSLVENVVNHTNTEPVLLLETNGRTVTIAVADGSRVLAGVREEHGPPSGLRIVAALCRAWGNAPTPTGKTVWAVIGPENRL
ncbi:sulfate transporter [Mycolicibacterium phlei]